ncbi:putative AAA family ATPase [Faustovirus]|nr:putative AAA family ATPase [Faustovirus]AMP44410.1 cell division protein FtsH [Faustovirus]
MSYTLGNLLTDLTRSVITEFVGYSTPIHRITTATAPNLINYTAGKITQLRNNRNFIKLTYTTSQGSYNYYYTSVAKYLMGKKIVNGNFELSMTRWMNPKELDTFKRGGKLTHNNDNPVIGEGEYVVKFQNQTIKVVSTAVTRASSYGPGQVSTNILKIYGNEELCKQFILYCYEEQVATMRDIVTYTWNHKWIEQKLYNCKTFDNLYLDAAFKQSIIDDLDRFKSSEDKYAKLGLCWKRGYLFYGKPGCGKTSTIYAIARYLKYNIYRINKSSIQSAASFRNACNAVQIKSLVVIDEVDQNIDVVDKTLKIDIPHEELVIILTELLTVDYGDTNMRLGLPDDLVDMLDAQEKLNVEQKARDIADVILEIGSVPIHAENYIMRFPNGRRLSHNGLRSTGDTTPLREFFWRYMLAYKPELSQRATVEKSSTAGIGLGDLLEILDGNEYLYGCIVVLTSNFPERIAGALLRPGRVDKVMEFKLADAPIIHEIAREFAGAECKLNIPEGFRCSQAEIIGHIAHYIGDVDKITEIVNNFCNAVKLPDVQLGKVVEAPKAKAETPNAANASANSAALAAGFPSAPLDSSPHYLAPITFGMLRHDEGYNSCDDMYDSMDDGNFGDIQSAH